MSQSRKSKSLSRLFSLLLPISDRYQGKEIDKDWELIDILDEEDGENEEASMDDMFSECSDDFIVNFSCDHPLVDKMKYTVMSKAEVLKHLEENISRFSIAFLLSKSEVSTILHHFKWNIEETGNEWLNEEKIRMVLGLYKIPVDIAPAAAEGACGMCLVNSSSMLGVCCGHQFCSSCLAGYISEAINAGPGCLALRCPDEYCDGAVRRDLIEQLSSKEDQEKFEDHLVRSFLLANKEAKWCPAPGCEYAVCLLSDGDGSSVTCRCSYTFCWNCTDEAHKPVDCDTAAKWRLLANSTPDTIYYQGVDFLESTGFRFDEPYPYPVDDYWKSLEFVKKHDDYWKSLEFVKKHEDMRKRDMVRMSYERYINFYEAWITSLSSKERAAETLKAFQNTHISVLCGIFDVSEKELNFLIDAQRQLVECYQIQKWTNVYAYFMSNDGTNKKCLFEFMQEQAKYLVRLLEKQIEGMDVFMYIESSLEQLTNFRRKIIFITRASKEHYEKMADAFEAGLPEVATIKKSSKALKIFQEETNKEKASTSKDRFPSYDF